MSRPSSPSALLTLCSLLLLCAACYDHSFTQAVQAKRRAAEAAKGAEVTSGGLERPIKNVGKVRVHASAGYRAQRSSWERRFVQQVDAAGAIVGPAFGIRLEVVETRGWEASCDPADLQACLTELVQHDAGDDVDWVVGLISAQSRFTTSFDQLGMATLPGRHLVLRDLYDPAEREAIDDAFAGMTREKRNEIYEQRQEHKRLVSFLHEWAHTLGALHTRRDDAILHRSYDDEISSFSEENQALIEASLKDRFPFDPAYSALTSYIAANDSDEWVPRSRETLLASLQVAATRSEAAARHPLVLDGDVDQLLQGVSAEDRAQYARAEGLLDRDQFAAWETLRPLLTRYPDCLAIQHFGCGLAMELGAREANQACTRAIALASRDASAPR